MIAPVSRIVLRYVAGYLVLKGIFDAKLGADLTSNPDVLALVQALIGGIIATATEWWYWLARRFGWSK